MAGVALGTNVVSVLPPAVPARPRISLLSQGNVVGDNQPTLVDSEGLLDSEQFDPWAFGAGTKWLDPITQFLSDTLWQGWPSGDGTTLADKSHAIDGSTDRTITRGNANLQPAQMPVMAVLFAKVGELTSHTLDQGPEGSVQFQAERAFDAMLPRLIETELWTALGAQSMAYDGQFRLEGQAVTVHVPTNTAAGFVRALGILESAVGNGGFLDQWGGAFYHCTRGLGSLLTTISSQGLTVDPTGRTIRTTASGASLVPESGATGIWPSQSGELQTTPGGTSAGDDLATGWLIASAPVRVRLGRRMYVEQHDLRASGGSQNNRVVLVEQPFNLESRLEVVAVPVDYTKEL